jgi:hypothetical protein
MFAVYRRPLRDPAQRPSRVVDRLREHLPGGEIGANGKALVSMAEDPGLGARCVQPSNQRAVGGLDAGIWSRLGQPTEGADSGEAARATEPETSPSQSRGR